ncbi:class I adenylate-forming enzyme family protein [Streptomyces sp. HNM0574]|uniref:class I adenylate-forming enzyme family protein n=1 Tax=Streptomyces sp. HNM0574 TaxID=2714954 RepID=UPI00146AB2D1|nr:class I adenylate-forming enzyme family protein [Streptomyces sp. HNM0574]NLU68144.1 acyl--CoA ligase [Streptomyces sp. HNM0574]
MGVLFDEAAARGAATAVRLDRPFDIAPDGGTHWTLPRLAALVARTASRLAAAGVGRGDRVAVAKDNHWDYDLLACAAVRLGAVPAQLSGQLAPETLGTLLRRLGPALLVTTPELLARCRAADVDPAALAKNCVTVTHALGDTPEDPTSPGAVPLLTLDPDTPAPHRGRHDDEPLVINHTSGTTGVPKLVTHSTRTIIRKLARSEAVRYPRIGARRDDTLLNASSYAHGRTFCWTGVAVSMAPREIVLLTDSAPETADPLLRAHPPTVVEALPSAYVRLQPLTERLDNPFRRVRLFISTYDAVHPPTLRGYLTASRHRSPLWMQGWGQTETGPLTFRFHTRGSVTGDSAPGTARDLGRPIPVRTRLRAVDPDTLEPVPRGRAGLLQARTGALGLGYIGEPERWARKEQDGWWTTGDIGILRRDGSVRLLDREVDSTPRLSCLETEDLLEDRLPEALECVVLGRPGTDPLPVVVTADGRLDGDSWRGAVAGLPRLAEPVVLTWRDVPRTGTGKVRRTALLHQLTGNGSTCGTGLWT